MEPRLSSSVFHTTSTSTLFIYSKEEEDGLQVLEQILPFFTPSLTVTVIMDDEMGYKVDVPIVLNSVDFENESYGPLQNRRYLIWSAQLHGEGRVRWTNLA
jgi:hypothetical protein